MVEKSIEGTVAEMASTSRFLVFVVAVGAAIASASPSEPVFRTQKERDYAVSAGLLAPEVRYHMTLAHTHSHCMFWQSHAVLLRRTFEHAVPHRVAIAHTRLTQRIACISDLVHIEICPRKAPHDRAPSAKSFPVSLCKHQYVNRHARCSVLSSTSNSICCNKAFVRQAHALVLMDSGDEDTHISRRVRLKRKDLRCDRLDGQGSVLRYGWYCSGCTHKLQCTQSHDPPHPHRGPSPCAVTQCAERPCWSTAEQVRRRQHPQAVSHVDRRRVLRRGVH
jgi:hypothetical protein